MNLPLTLPERAPDAHTARRRLTWQPSAAEPEEESFDVYKYILPVWRRKWLVLVAALIGAAIAVAVAFNMEDRFTASARVIFEPERVRIIDLDSVLVSPDSSSTGLQNQIEILRSATLLDRVIDTLRLQNAPEFNPGLRPSAPSLFERAVRRIDPPELALRLLVKFDLIGATEPEQPTAQEQAARLRASMLDQLGRNLRLRPLPNSRVIEIGYISSDPVLAANIANTVAEQYIVVQAERKSDAIAGASETLSVRVQDLENRLNAAEEAVRIAQLELTIDSQYGSALIGKQLELLNEALTEARLERSALEERYQRVDAAVIDQGSYSLLPEFRESPVISSYMAKEREVLEEIASFRAIVADEQSPQLLQLNARLDRVRRNMWEEAENIAKALETSLASAREREAALAQELSALEDRAVEQARAEMRISRLEREAQAARVIYETFLNRLQETREQANLQTPDASFLTRATIPSLADSRAPLSVAAFGGFGGIGVGIALVFLLEMLNSSFRDPDAIEAATGMPVLASIPMAGRRKRPRRLIRQVLRAQNSAFAESIRNLRTSLLFLNEDVAPKTVMFASSLPGEGKTTTALLMAVLSRQMDRTSLIVDCDLRRQTLGRSFTGDDPGKGLLAVLDGTATLDEAVSIDPETGVHVLAAEANGRMPKNPADLLSSHRFRTLVEQLKATYDLVLFDTPPTLAVTDARIVAQAMDAIVYLVAWNRTPRSAVAHGLRELASVNGKMAGVALTLVSDTRSSGYSRNHYYYTRPYSNVAS